MKYEGPVTPAPFKGHLAGQGRDKIVKLSAAALDECWQAAGLNSQGKLGSVSKG